MNFIEFRNVEKSFGGNKVLTDINLSIEKGKLITLLGPSGCGKSTLLRCFAGLENMDQGSIFLDGSDITELPPRERQIGLVFQQYSLFPNMNVFENIAFGLKMKKTPAHQIEQMVREMIETVELKGKEEEYPHNLSGGQQQRVALARAIVMRPKVLLLDEPLSAIDAKLRKSLQKEIKRIQTHLGITTIFVTHDQDEAMILSDVIHLFNKGVIEQSGTPNQFYTQPKTTFAASFIGNYNIFSEKDFFALTGKETHNKVAIRTETLELRRSQETLSNRYQFQGKIIDYLLHGNVIRYNILVGEIKIEADALFRSVSLFENNDTVFIAVDPKNCIHLEG